jgi:hypothetical protein
MAKKGVADGAAETVRLREATSYFYPDFDKYVLGFCKFC